MAADRDAGGLDPATLAVVLGRGDQAEGDPVGGTGVQFTSTYRAGGSRTYGRDHNATWEAFEEVIGALEGGRAVAFASGLAAISAVIEQLSVGAVVVAPGDAYNGTRRLLADLESRRRVVFRPVDITDTSATVAACEGAALLWVETPTNPLMAIADIAALADGAHALGVNVAVDNTFATPLLQQPLALGADVVVHSVTKQIAGHSDIVMGVAIAGTDEMHEALVRRRGLHGAIPGPMETFLALRGVRTLPVRLARAQATAGELARRLEADDRISIVRYPGLPSHPGHELAGRQMAGPGTMLSFDLVGGMEAADALCARVQLCVPATSLGGVETLVERRGKWEGESLLPPALVRLSAGLEDVDDLWRDLDRALG
ncbi:MAG TPA: PLP-dependent transferase [Acidimicrobiales bacterium]|nr:PLP-dependent transferase [Acidimicrobiales bacterium]